MQEKNGYQHRRLDGMRKQVINNPRYPHHVKVVRITYPDNDWLDDEPSEPTETVLYSGEGRCFTNGTVNEKQVDISHRYISIPVRPQGTEALGPGRGRGLYRYALPFKERLGLHHCCSR